MERQLEVDEHYIGIEDFEGFYTEHTNVPTVGIERTMCRDRCEALVLEAESIVETRIMRRDGRELFLTPKSYETMCRRRLSNLKQTIEDTRPEWVEVVYEACQAADNIHVAVSLAGFSERPYPAVAIIELLQEWDEIPMPVGYFNRIR